MKDVTDKEEKGVKVNSFMSLFAIYCFVYASGNAIAKCFAMLRDMFILWNCPSMKQYIESLNVYSSKYFSFLQPHCLAHEIGAGAPCLTCGDKCPGLDLHFWRYSSR